MNWKTLIAEILASGLSQQQIAERLNRSQAWVSAAAGGKYNDLKWADGEAIRVLHQEICRSDVGQVRDSPIVPVGCASGDPHGAERRKDKEVA